MWSLFIVYARAYVLNEMTIFVTNSCDMNKIKAAVVGYGNIGKYVLEALQTAPDFEIAGIVRRDCTGDMPSELAGYRVVSDITELDNPDVAILAVPSRKTGEYACKMLGLGINTVDSFDIHTLIPETRQRIGKVAREAGKVSVISAGWDPGSDSIIRALMQAMTPNGITYTNFGPGMSMGHTVAVKAIEGVKAALSMTIPVGTGIHRRMVYVELEDGYKLAEVAEKIKKDPYFANDETHVMQVESVEALKDMGHGVNLVRKGVSGKTQNQLLEYDMKINNPALTGQILVCAARAAVRQSPGCYTMIEIPVIDLLPGDRDMLVAGLV